MRRAWGVVGRHRAVSALLLIVIAVAGAFVFRQVEPIVIAQFDDVKFVPPLAPHLTPGAGERLFRIDPSLSKATYAVDEEFAGNTTGTATGTTRGIAGDIAVNTGNPAATRVGEIDIDLEQLTSDSSLRDARIRHDFLQSSKYPLARFTTTKVEGLPGHIRQGKDLSFTMTGDLNIRTTTKPVTFSVDAVLRGDEMQANATATIKMSDFGIGPIDVVGLVSTADEIKLTFELVAVDPSTRTVSTQIPAPELAAAKKNGPSFSSKVQPILERNCASCHAPGEIGAGDWKLATAGDAARYASGIGLVTRTKYMPPWPASDKSVPLQHPRNLSTADLKTISDWAAAGGPLDVPTSTKVRAKPDDSDVVVPRHDEVLTMDRPYRGTGEIKNDYRCFVLDPKFTKPTFMTGYEFLPDQRQVLHHVIVYRVGAQARAETDRLDGADGRPGWPCFVGTGLRSANPAAGAGGGNGLSLMVGGWVPGQRPADFGEGAGMKFEAGDLLIMQVHYHYDDQVLPDRSKFAIEVAPDGTDLRKIQVFNPIAPVEIPCATGESGPLCDRASMMKYIRDTYGPIAAGIPGFALKTCGHTVADFADQTEGTGWTSCDTPLRGNGEIVAVHGHMHQLGKSFRMTLNPGRPDEKVLLDIPTWNFEWQLNYPLVTPVRVKPGDNLRIECTWDRSLKYTPQPRYLLFSEGTDDEMCFSTFSYIADDSP
ncbi:MAG: YceI family protein [Acidimicrobiales bacterium]